MSKETKKKAGKNTCPYCEGPVSETPAPVCQSCKTDLFHCPKCEASLPQDYEVCPRCGANIKK